MTLETIQRLEELIRSERRAVMATLVRTVGTTPRKEGARMFVLQDGTIHGSVTIGGCVDARVIEASAAVLDGGEPRLIRMRLGNEEAWEIGLTCGGEVDVFVEPVRAPVAEAWDAAAAQWRAGLPVAVATLLSGEGAGARVVIGTSGVLYDGAGAGHADTLLREIAPLLRPPHGSRTLSAPGSEVFVEIVRPPSTLVIFGGGAVSIPLVTFARTLGFRSLVIDSRERFANRDRFPHADDVRAGIPTEIAGQIDLGPSTPVILVVHDYKIDIPVLKKVLGTSVPYIGVLGSRRRGAALLDQLRGEGVAEEQLGRVRVPIGLDLGGDSAAEIALSIMAEVVAVMHGRSGDVLSRAAPAESRA